MEERVNFTFVPSLTRSILAKIAITLWHQDDVRDLVSDFYFPLSTLDFYERLEKWQEVEGEVMKQVPKLQLPEILRKKLSYFVGAVGWQIIIWKDCHQNNLRTCSFRKNWNKICWTSQGTIDKKKTADILVKIGNLSIANRYKLACTYCLEDDIYTLWKHLCDKQFHGKDLKKIRMHESSLVSFWSHHVEGKTDELDRIMRIRYRNFNFTLNEYAFQHSAKIGNVAAARYFLQKLTPEEKERVLVKTAKSVAWNRCNYIDERKKFPEKYYTDVLCFLLSTMDKEEQIEVFKTYPHQVLKCLLDWPWQDFFMETANCMWTFLLEEDYDSLLRTMINVVTAGYKDYNYQKLFGEFWQQGPDAYKRHVIDRCALGGTLLTDLFESESKEMISLILKDANHVEKEKILHLKGKNICRKLIYDDEWDLLKFFIGECVSSQETLIKLKELFKDPVTWRCSKQQLQVMKYDRDKFFEILDYFSRRFNKRESAKEDFPAKKFRTAESDRQNSDKSINSDKTDALHTF